MAKRHPRENILVQWTIDEACWRRFQAASQARLQQRDRSYVAMKAPEPFPVEGLEVAIRDDALFIGKRDVSEYVYNGGMHWMGVYESWLEVYIPSDSSPSIYLIPIAPAALLETKRVVAEFTAQDREAARIQAELDARPTLINNLRRWVEANAMLTIIGFFVVVLPLFVLAIHLLSLAFPSWFGD
jgi:hypothetical protein